MSDHPDTHALAAAHERFVMACAVPGELGFIRADGTVVCRDETQFPPVTVPVDESRFPPVTVFIEPQDSAFFVLVKRLAPGKTNTIRTDRYRLHLEWQSATDEAL